MLAFIQDALMDTLCVVFGTRSRTPVAKCLCKVQDLGPEWLVEVVEVVKPSKSLFQRHIMISQSVRIPLLPVENTHHLEILGMQKGGWQGHQLYFFSSEEPQVWLLVLGSPVHPWMWSCSPWAKVQPYGEEILEQLLPNISSSDLVTQMETPQRKGMEEGAGI